jgi:GTP diphosphokinase / guanosine-3',5'-bis(diphosphate) 3'-diphosphatase
MAELVVKTPDELYQELAATVAKNIPNFSEPLLRKAYEFAKKCHGEQKRQSGEPYVTHPLEVATIVASFKVDQASIIAALLHDVVEDTEVSLETIEREFDKTIAELVDGLTKIARIEFRSSQERLAENFRKMVLAMAKDIRVIIVKLADRLHNMRTMKALPEAKRLRIAQETMDIYAPLANRLGMYGVKSELEDLCLRQIKPDVYADLKSKISSKKNQRLQYIEEVKEILITEMQKYSFTKFEVTGRPKHFYSIYKKMLDRTVVFEDINDLFAFRIIVDSIRDCYEALGVVHAMWKPMPGRFKDYIAMPKANMYQSLHTTVIRPSGEPCEIQIRTRAMHEVCEYGVAAHWNYKEKGSTTAKPSPESQKMAWLNQIVEWQSELKDPDEFMEAVKVDLFEEEIFVFTPKGDVLQLPIKATALDFAFAVHSAVGQSTIGAKVNGRMVPIKKELKSGDIIEIVTSSKQHPNKNWLSFVTTSRAKNRIRSFLRAEQREKSRLLGQEILRQELTARHLDFDKMEKSGELLALSKTAKESNVDDMLIAFGYGKLNPEGLLDRAYPPKPTQTLVEEQTRQESQSIAVSPNSAKQTGKGRGILVSGLDNLLVVMARCCNPLPGEDIVGFVTRGRGVTIHRYDCSRARDLDPARRVEANWGQPKAVDGAADFSTHLRIVTIDKPGILAEITTIISSSGANIFKAQVQVGKDALGVIDFEIRVRDAVQLQIIMQKIESTPSVMRIERKIPGYNLKKRKVKKTVKKKAGT